MSSGERHGREAVVWETLRDLILDRHDYRRQVAEALGMSFFRVKALRMLESRPMTMREIASELSTDAPYSTLLIDDLEQRGLAVRSPSEADRRFKVVTITEAGRAAAKIATEILMTPPPTMQTLTDEDFAALERVVRLLAE